MIYLYSSHLKGGHCSSKHDRGDFTLVYYIILYYIILYYIILYYIILYYVHIVEYKTPFHGANGLLVPEGSVLKTILWLCLLLNYQRSSSGCLSSTMISMDQRGSTSINNRQVSTTDTYQQPTSINNQHGHPFYAFIYFYYI